MDRMATDNALARLYVSPAGDGNEVFKNGQMVAKTEYDGIDRWVARSSRPVVDR